MIALRLQIGQLQFHEQTRTDAVSRKRSSCACGMALMGFRKVGTDVGMTPCPKLLKQEGTARRIESMQQSSATQSLHLWFLGVAEDCCMLSILLAVPSCFNSFWHGVIPTAYFIFNDFYTCILSNCTMSKDKFCPTDECTHIVPIRDKKNYNILLKI